MHNRLYKQPGSLNCSSCSASLEAYGRDHCNWYPFIRDKSLRDFWLEKLWTTRLLIANEIYVTRVACFVSCFLLAKHCENLATICRRLERIVEYINNRGSFKPRGNHDEYIMKAKNNTFNVEVNIFHTCTIYRARFCYCLVKFMRMNMLCYCIYRLGLACYFVVCFVLMNLCTMLSGNFCMVVLWPKCHMISTTINTKTTIATTFDLNPSEISLIKVYAITASFPDPI